jgi:hypothetical protein
MPRDISEEHAAYHAALKQIIRYRHTPRAYRHAKFEHLISIAEKALAATDDDD